MLRDRPTGPCSAVCVPISFMGRALGVLHTTGPEGQVASREQIAQLTTLATQAGARIGTVRAFEKTQLQAATDSLTGLINRRTFEQRVRELIGQERPFALAVADLDHFKRINDAHGHEAGDRALRLFAQVARQVLRDGDLLARWGGEEFVFALAEIDRDGAVGVLNRIRANLAEAFSGDAPRFTASFGVTDSAEPGDLDRLMQIADAGLYTSKQDGRDRVTIGAADPELPPHDPAHAGAGLRPLLHEAADVEEPRPTGLEIR
jgi:diguanylate cyclase (GGDEF)-like protein